eukprot:m.362094 g.362094  ORF g.362094 m.362094 type:complete len:383 (-) comp20121_c0_seq1:219-1367(-)
MKHKERIMASSFRKRTPVGAAPSLPVGVKPSLANGQLLTSTGISSLDHLLGGGLGIGTVMLVESERLGSHADILLRYFLSEGMACDHHLAVVSADQSPAATIKNCPQQYVSSAQMSSSTSSSSSSPSTASSPSPAQTPQDMRIAWRYNSLPTVQATVGQQKPLAVGQRYCHTFDLSKKVGEQGLKVCKHVDIDLSDSDPSVFDSALSQLAEAMAPFQVVPTRGDLALKTVQRIAIQLIGSPFWFQDAQDDTQKTTELCRFLMRLRSVLRRSCSVCCITVPTNLFTSDHLKQRIRSLGDVVVRPETFVGTPNEGNPVLKEYHGFFRVVKLPLINTIIPSSINTDDLAFKLKRKAFSIETIHLPPDLAEDVSRSQEDASPCSAL